MVFMIFMIAVIARFIQRTVEIVRAWSRMWIWWSLRPRK